MSKKKSKPPASSPPGVPAWMVTFSDCMTLLLCFFVLLLTFSSFDDVALDKLGGGLSGRSYKSIFPNKRTIKDALVPPRDTQLDHTSEGSERPTQDEPRSIENPRQSSEALSNDVYRDRQAFTISSSKVFHGEGPAIKKRGREMLSFIAKFIRMMPCQIVIGEARPSHSRMSLSRPLAILEYFTEIEGIPAERFSISAGGCIRRQRQPDGPTVEVLLLVKGLSQ